MPFKTFGSAAAYAGLLLKTRQTTCYHVGDDGDFEKGLAESYTVLSTGAQSLTTNVDSPHYAAATISFDTASKEIRDSANLLATVLTGDTIRVRGSVSNDGVYTVATGGAAAKIITTEALLADEAAGAYITICKRVAPSNNCVQDNVTGLMWLRYTTGGPVLRVGAASDGKLNWYDATKCYVIHAAAGDLQIIASTRTLKIVGGAGEVARYYAGQVFDLTGFAVANNNKPGYVVQSVTVNGADLDIVLWSPVADVTATGTTTNGNKVISGLPSTANLRIGMAITGTGVGAASVIASIDSATQVTGTVNSTATGTVSITFRIFADEAASGSRSITLVCQSVFAYCAAANAASLGGYTDWRVPVDVSLKSLCDMEAATALPNAVAFPSWSTLDWYWSATTLPTNTTNAMIVLFYSGYVSGYVRPGVFFLALVRG